MLSSVLKRGYSETTVSDVVANAAVSKTTFYQQFVDREACFLAAHRYAMDLVFERMNAAAAESPARNWKQRMRSDLSTYLTVLADEPALAVTLHVAILAAGPAALDRRAELLGRLALRTASTRALAQSTDRTPPELPASTFALYVGGLDELIRDRLRLASAEALRDLVEPVLEGAFALFGS
ncbi:MAG: TetR/AcrR family transcriptional regulator [Solirubrobacteraceae bacterium]